MNQPIPTWIVAGPSGSGKSALVHGLSAHCPEQELWTVLLHAQTDEWEKAYWSNNVHRITLAGGCACCSSKVVFHTHLSRTLRLRRPHRLFIEISEQGHPHNLTEQLSETQWQPWIDVKGVIHVLNPQHQRYTMTVTEHRNVLHVGVMNRCDQAPGRVVDACVQRLKQTLPIHSTIVCSPTQHAGLHLQPIWPLSQIKVLEKAVTHP